MKIRRIVFYSAIMVFCILLLNMKVPTKQGINYKVYTYEIPLYIKAAEFLDRDYRYRALARRITASIDGDEKKTMAILEWVQYNIKKDFPKEWPVYDDHIWNIIIRGYGTDDQISDVFATLCMYAGLPAGWARVYIPGYGNGLALSFVNIGGKWRVFDVWRETHFLNNAGEIASTEDIISGAYEKEIASKAVPGFDRTYEEYFRNMQPYLVDLTSRSKKQMPFGRAVYELRAAFGFKEKDRNDKRIPK